MDRRNLPPTEMGGLVALAARDIMAAAPGVMSAGGASAVAETAINIVEACGGDVGAAIQLAICEGLRLAFPETPEERAARIASRPRREAEAAERRRVYEQKVEAVRADARSKRAGKLARRAASAGFAKAAIATS